MQSNRKILGEARADVAVVVAPVPPQKSRQRGGWWLWQGRTFLSKHQLALSAHLCCQRLTEQGELSTPESIQGKQKGRESLRDAETLPHHQRVPHQ